MLQNTFEYGKTRAALYVLHTAPVWREPWRPERLPHQVEVPGEDGLAVAEAVVGVPAVVGAVAALADAAEREGLHREL